MHAPPPRPVRPDTAPPTRPSRSSLLVHCRLRSLAAHRGEGPRSMSVQISLLREVKAEEGSGACYQSHSTTRVNTDGAIPAPTSHPSPQPRTPRPPPWLSDPSRHQKISLRKIFWRTDFFPLFGRLRRTVVRPKTVRNGAAETFNLRYTPEFRRSFKNGSSTKIMPLD